MWFLRALLIGYVLMQVHAENEGKYYIMKIFRNSHRMICSSMFEREYAFSLDIGNTKEEHLRYILVFSLRS